MRYVTCINFDNPNKVVTANVCKVELEDGKYKRIKGSTGQIRMDSMIRYFIEFEATIVDSTILEP